MTAPGTAPPRGTGTTPPPAGRAARDGIASGGISLGRPFGIPVYLSPSWFLFAGFVTLVFADAVAQALPDLGAARYAVSGSFAVLLAVSVLLHELGHCVVARVLGLRVRRVTIFLLGGVSEIETDPDSAAQEYLVAVVGPLVSLTLGGLGGVAYLLAPEATVTSALTFLFATANAVVALFNLLPGLPLDGGRVLRAAVWRVSGDKLTGTRWAARSGQGLAVVLFLALVLRPAFAAAGGRAGTSVLADLLFATLFSTFIYAGATQALRSAEVSARVPLVSARALVRRPLTVTADLPLAEAVRQAHDAQARGLVVVDSSGRPDALVSEAAVLATPAERRPWVTVGSLARRVEPAMVLSLDATGKDVVEAVRGHGATEYLVVDADGALVGVLNESDVALRLGGGR